MKRTEARQGVRMMKFLDILSRYEAAEFSQAEAAELLGGRGADVSTVASTIRRGRRGGTVGRRPGKISGKRVPADREAAVEALYRGHYSGFTA